MAQVDNVYTNKRGSGRVKTTKNEKETQTMKQFFKELFEYNYHFNQKLCDVFLDSPEKTSEKSVRLFNHLLNAQQIWNNRIDRKEPAFGVWELHNIKDLKNIDGKNYKQALQILEKSDLDETISYSNSKGETFSNCIRDILFHVINHSTYHRGQIATEFKQQGLEPLVTDYIFYKR